MNESGRVNDNDELSAENESTNELNEFGRNDETEPTVNDEPLIDESTDDNDNDRVDPLANIKTEIVPLYEHARNSAEIEELLDEPEVIDLSDGEEMIVSEIGLPKPFGMTDENMIKRENDKITGNVPFNIKVGI